MIESENIKITIFHALFFCLLMLSWPIRNALVFNQGFYLTASEGATFSKGWNEDVVKKFSNVDGDLADEGLNLKYLDTKTQSLDVIQKSKVYKKATKRFIKNLKISDVFEIALTKLKSNFVPYPEKPKKAIIESLGTFFRFLYLMLFVQSIYLLIVNRFRLLSENTIIFPFIVLIIYLAQSIMSIYIYTGLRFNSIYGLTLFLSLIMINRTYILNFINKIRSLNKLKINSN